MRPSRVGGIAVLATIAPAEAAACPCRAGPSSSSSSALAFRGIRGVRRRRNGGFFVPSERRRPPFRLLDDVDPPPSLRAASYRSLASQVLPSPVDGPSSSSSSSSSSSPSPSLLLDCIASHPAVAALSLSERPRAKLAKRHEHLFDANATHSLLDRMGIVACRAGVVPRKELFETVAAATVVHDAFPDTRRVADLAAGHGLLSWCLLLLDEMEREKAKEKDDDADERRRRRSAATTGGVGIGIGIGGEEREEEATPRPSRPRTAVCVDARIPPSADSIASEMLRLHPQLSPRWCYVQGRLDSVESHPTCLLVSVHACGTLSDSIVELAVNGRAPMALAPCCHTINVDKGYRPHRLTGWTAEDVAEMVSERRRQYGAYDSSSGGGEGRFLADVVDEVRAIALRKAGYEYVVESTLPERFTARNRLLLAAPRRTMPLSPTDERHESGSTAKSVVVRPRATFFERERPGGDGDGKKEKKYPPLRIPVANDPASIEACRSISGRDQAAARLREHLPRHFDTYLDVSMWLPDDPSSSFASLGGDRNHRKRPVDEITVDKLADLAKRCCADADVVECGVTCTVEALGGLFVHPTSKRRAQTYRMSYHPASTKVNDARRRPTTLGSDEGVPRHVAIAIQDEFRRRVQKEFNVVVR